MPAKNLSPALHPPQLPTVAGDEGPCSPQPNHWGRYVIGGKDFLSSPADWPGQALETQPHPCQLLGGDNGEMGGSGGLCPCPLNLPEPLIGAYHRAVSLPLLTGLAWAGEHSPSWASQWWRRESPLQCACPPEVPVGLRRGQGRGLHFPPHQSGYP